LSAKQRSRPTAAMQVKYPAAGLDGFQDPPSKLATAATVLDSGAQTHPPSLRHVDLEPAAAAVQSLHDLHNTAHLRRCLLDNGQAKTRPSGVAVLPAVEPVEDPGAVTFLNSGPVIRNGQ